MEEGRHLNFLFLWHLLTLYVILGLNHLVSPTTKTPSQIFLSKKQSSCLDL